MLSHNPNGIEIQFYIFMIAHLLLLSFKQNCAIIDEGNQLNTEETPVKQEKCNDNNCYSQHELNTISGRQYVCGLVTLLGKGLQKYWKISLHWITALKNALLKPFTVDTVNTIMKF